MFNRALIGKWSWRFSVLDNTLWKDLIKTKYGIDEGGWITRAPSDSYGVGLWKEIRQETLMLKSNSVFLVGEGSTVRFWEDTWCGSNPLYTTFLHVYSLADSKGARVVEVWDALVEEGGWNPRFVRRFNDWEMDMVQSFFDTISNKRILPSIKDKLMWKKIAGGLFSVKSCFDLLEGDSQLSSPTRMLWNSNIPTKMGFFDREVWWDKALTMKNLKRRGVPFVSRCPLCGEAEEDLHHLLVHCPKIWEL